MISQQLNFFSPLNFNLSYLQIGGLALLLVISSPFLLFAWQYLDFLLFSPLRTLPRASSKNANRDIRASEPVVNELKWLEENDSTVITWTNDLGMLDLYVADPKALSWILGSQGYRYRASPSSRRLIQNLLGDGVIWAQGDVHRRQRKALGPAFHPNVLRAFVPIFFQHSRKLLKRLEELDESYTRYPAGEGKVINIEKYLTRTTLDVIGAAGFGYDYKALDSGDSTGSKLSEAIAATVKSFRPTNWFETILTSVSVQQLLPFLGDHPIVKRNRKITRSRKVTEDVAKEILAAKLEKIKKEQAADGNSKLNKDSEALGGSDVIDFILRATLASDLKANEKLFFKEILPQLASLTFAGSDTTSTLLQSCLVHLGRRPDIQDRLQVELDDFFSSLPEDTDPDWDQINALPFLSSVISEVLRFSPPVPGLQRNPMNDDIIPLSRPIKCTDGKMISHIKVKKGTNILLGTGANARLKEIWGEDADQFNPDRWLNLPQSHRDAQMPSPHSQFGFGAGPKVCLGARFATTEAKCIAATLLRKYRVEHVEEITWRQFLVNRTCIKGRESEGPQLPMRMIKRVRV